MKLAMPQEPLGTHPSKGATIIKTKQDALPNDIASKPNTMNTQNTNSTIIPLPKILVWSVVAIAVVTVIGTVKRIFSK